MRVTFYMVKFETVTVEAATMEEAEALAAEQARANFIAGAAQFEVDDYQEEE